MEKLYKETERGRLSAELLNNPVLTEAMSAIELEIITQWGNCPARDKEGKEALWQLYKMSQKFKNILSGYIETGKLAREDLKQHEGGLRSKAKDFIRRVA